MKLAQTIVMDLVEESEELEVEVYYPTTPVYIYPEFSKSYSNFLRRKYSDEEALEYEASCCEPYKLTMVAPVYYGRSSVMN